MTIDFTHHAREQQHSSEHFVVDDDHVVHGEYWNERGLSNASDPW